ncbi:MAG TPA: hypothetical protein VE224_15195, partial [Pseudolabrys sp.]|nr:hypothetical protein [Pseudolabrys sp.]
MMSAPEWILRVMFVGTLAAAPMSTPAQQNQGGGLQGKGLDTPVSSSAQHRQHKAQTAQDGAGTDDGTTTGSSGPKKHKGSGQPPKPQSSLCKNYSGAVKQD